MAQSPFVAEITIYPYNFAPTGWASCDGQLLPLSQNTALFSLLGTTYGGDGKSTFALPDLQGAVPLGAGQSPGGSLYDLGEQAGTDSVTLLQSEMPLHTHTVSSAPPNFSANSNLCANNSMGKSAQGNAYTVKNAQNVVQMSFNSLAPAGSGFPHNNLQPYLTLNFCIALQGVFPQRP